MDTLKGIIGPAITFIAFVLLLFPKLRGSNFIKRLLIAFIALGCLFTFFNSSWYLNWRYFDDDKIYIFFQQLPHIIEEDDNQLNSYIVIIENNYQSNIKLKNFEVDINSRMPLLDYKILLSDFDENLVHFDIKNNSQLLLNIDETSGGQIICFNFTCTSFLGKKPENVTMALSSIPFQIQYALFDKSHSKTIDKGINVRLSNKIYHKKDIIFEKMVAIDHRKVFTEFTEYRYCQFEFDNGLQNIEVSCSSDKYIIVTYRGTKGTLKYKSKNKICPTCHKIDVLNMRVFKDEYFLIEESTEFEKQKD